MTKNKDIREKLANYVINNSKSDFKKLVKSLIEDKEDNQKQQKRINII